MADPTDLFAFDEIARIVKRDIDVAVVTEGQLLESIDRGYRRTEEITGLARELSEDLGDTYVDFGALTDTVGIEEAPVVKLLQTMFDDATQVRASDIHIEPQEGRLMIRFRIDGALQGPGLIVGTAGPHAILGGVAADRRSRWCRARRIRRHRQRPGNASGGYPDEMAAIDVHDRVSGGPKAACIWSNAKMRRVHGEGEGGSG